MIKWIYGNTLPLVVELKEVIKTQEGTTTEDYIPPVGSEIEVWAIGEYKKKRFDYTIDGNVLQFTDDGTLNVGTYGIRITVLEPESRRLRSFKCDELQIVNCTEDLDLGEFIQEDAVYLDAMPFFWAKGDKGDPFTYDDFTPEQLAGLVGQGVPQGGEQGQILVKNSDADYDTIWLANATGVTSVNGKTGIVTLDAQDVQALPQDTPLFSGDYNDLANKPTIPIVPTNVSAFNNDAHYYPLPNGGIPKADLTSDVRTSLGRADTALQNYTETDPTVPSWAKQPNKPSYRYSEISDTPTLAIVATSGNYNDLSNKPTIPTVPTNVSAFNNDAGYLTEHQDISGKEDKTSIENVPTGSVALSADVSKYYTFVDAIETFAITLPSPTDATKVQTIVFFMTIGTTPAITFSSANTILYQKDFTLEAGKTYEVNALWNGNAWVIASVEIEEA